MPESSDGVYKNTRSRAKARLKKAEKAMKEEKRRRERINVKTAAELSKVVSQPNSFNKEAIALLQSIESTKVTPQQIEDCRQCVKKKKKKKLSEGCEKVCEYVDPDEIYKLTEEQIKKIKSKIAELRKKMNKFKDEPQLKF
tara:strand:+ start:821 stop:1243 length:423 start_codon:yes stop_codon:yes gene_type:complete